MSDWRPAADLEVLKLRARLFAETRRFFAERGLMEVDTPVLSAAAVSDVHIASLETRIAGPVNRGLFLQTSPESAMKRLLASGSGSIYQFARVFRDAESGRLHNPEFVLLEWYRLDCDPAALMDEVEALVTRLLGAAPAAQRISYRQAFQRHAGIDPFEATPDALRSVCRSAGLEQAMEDPEFGLDFIFSQVVQPRLGGGMTFIYDFPAAQSSQATVRPGTPAVAERFELLIDGIEIANGYRELDDPTEQARRIDSDLARRRRLGKPGISADRRLIAALEHGLPACSGVAVGFDRLVMLAAGLDDLRGAVAFPIDRA